MSGLQIIDIPWFSSTSVIVCHLLVATNQLLPFLRHERSMTRFDVSLLRASRTDFRRGRENLAEGKRKDVIMT